MIFRIVACLTILIGTAAIAQGRSEPHFDVTTKQAMDKGFAPPPEALRKYLVAHEAPKTVQHFCVVGYGTKASGIDVHVHWREGMRLTRWEKTAYNGIESLLMGRDDLSLKTDIVATQEQIGGSTYLQPRAWANKIISECKKTWAILCNPAKIGGH